MRKGKGNERNGKRKIKGKSINAERKGNKRK